MDFIRYIFLLLIIIGSTSIGFLLAKRYNSRIQELKKLLNLINIFQNKMKFTHKPLKDIMEETAKISNEDEISDIFFSASVKLKEKPLEMAWKESIDEKTFLLNLKKEDIDLIKSLSNLLGKTDIDGQMSEIEQFKILLNSNIKNAEEEKEKNAKMYKSLGTIIGLAIVIILY